jgi:hypothetical protein
MREDINVEQQTEIERVRGRLDDVEFMVERINQLSGLTKKGSFNILLRIVRGMGQSFR